MGVVIITDKDLMRPVGALVLLESALQVARYLVAPSSVQVICVCLTITTIGMRFVVFFNNQTLSLSSNPILTYQACVSSGSYFSLLLYGYKGLLLV